MKFLADKDMSPVTCLRDSQNYVQAAAEGMGIHDMKANLTRVDREHWQSLIDWLETKQLYSDADTLAGDKHLSIA
jgi:chromosome partitioning protein